MSTTRRHDVFAAVAAACGTALFGLVLANVGLAPAPMPDRTPAEAVIPASRPRVPPDEPLEPPRAAETLARAGRPALAQRRAAPDLPPHFRGQHVEPSAELPAAVERRPSLRNDGHALAAALGADLGSSVGPRLEDWLASRGAVMTALRDGAAGAAEPGFDAEAFNRQVESLRRQLVAIVGTSADEALRRAPLLRSGPDGVLVEIDASGRPRTRGVETVRER
jgi:hypothetical protein